MDPLKLIIVPPPSASPFTTNTTENTTARMILTNRGFEDFAVLKVSGTSTYEKIQSF